MEATVYILRCSDGSTYTGLTRQPVEARLWEHNAGIHEGYTHSRRPVTLVFTETYDRLLDAIARAADQGLEPYQEGSADRATLRGPARAFAQPAGHDRRRDVIAIPNP